MATSAIGGTGSVSSLGVGSGLDASSIITKLMAVEAQPLTDLKKKETDLRTKVSLFGQVQSLFGDLQTAANNLKSTTLWNQTVASSDNGAAVGVSTGSGALAGNYAVAVSQLASRQTVTSSVYAASTTALAAGTLTLELGQWTGTPASGFAAKAGTTPVTITLGAGDDLSLAGLRDKINAAGAGVTATIVTDNSGARLSIRSTDSGAVNGFRLTAAGGLTGFAYDATAPSPLALNQAAQNAQATINGIPITSSSNTLTNVIDGVTLNLQARTTTDANITVNPDGDAVSKGVDAFVKAYNAVASFIATQTKYDPASKTGAPLQGNSTVVGLLWQLRGVLNQFSSASTAYTALSDVGITMQADGTLATNASKLGAAITNRSQLQKLLATSGADTASSGFMVRFSRLADAVLGVDGSLTTASSTLQSQISKMVKREDDMQRRLDATQARLTAQYQALDAQMANLNSLSNYVTAQLAAWNKASN